MPQELVFPPPEEPSILSLPLPHAEAYPGEPREYALALIQRKDAIQKEIASLNIYYPIERNANPSRMSSMKSCPQYVYFQIMPKWADKYQHGATASTSLLDNEGYPRGDLDIVRVLFFFFLFRYLNEPHTHAFLTSMLSDMPVLRLFAFKMTVRL